MENIIYIGSEIKLNISINPIGNYTMDDYQFECEFFCFANRRLTLGKEQMIRTDENNYVAVLDSRALGAGALRCKITAYIPDADCEDNLRTEVCMIETGMRITNS